MAKVESPRSTGGYPTSSRKQQSATTGEKGATTSPLETEGGHSEGIIIIIITAAVKYMYPSIFTFFKVFNDV